jgi:hypothetical protein
LIPGRKTYDLFIAKPGGIFYNSFMKTVTLPTNSIHRPLLERALPLIPLLLVCFALLPRAQAVSPAPDGGYPGGTTAEGTDALFSLSSGIDNTALGFQALYHNTTGNYNTAEGFRALFGNTTGRQNTATGVNALTSNTTGNFNTANGVNTLYRNTTGLNNTASGVQALFNNTTGNQNVANGVQALNSNTTGSNNVANGYQALYSNIAGFGNVANGYQALISNTIGVFNTANGALALFANTTGLSNTAIGGGALSHNTTGTHNTANGYLSLFSNTTGTFNTANGDQALYTNTTGSSNIVLGFEAGQNLTTGDFNIDIGNVGVAGESDTIRIGEVEQSRTFIAGIRGVTTGNGDAVNVVIDSAGQLGTVSSSRRFKNEIKPMDSASEAILALKPVTFHYKSDSTGTPQFGLIAEEVAEVNPDLVVRDENGEIYTVRYDAMNAMLLNEFLKEHRKVEEQNGKLENQARKIQEQETTITLLKSAIAQERKDFDAIAAQQQKEIQALTAGLKEQAAQIQKVNAQLDASKTAPQIVNNNQ